MKTLIYSLFAIFFTLPCLAADGPENSGTFTINNAQDDQFEANLQIDRSILKHTDSEVLALVAITTGGVLCNGTQIAAIENPDVLTASLLFVCPEGTSVLNISLKKPESLPNNFTMGVRSAVDHFVLTKDAPNVQTILKPEFAFALAGMTLFLEHPIAEKVHIGRPHAFFFGGLTALPSGFYFLLLVAALWLTTFSVKTKCLASVAALAIATWVTAYVIGKQATLSIVSVKVLGILFLTMTACTLALSFTKVAWPKYLAALSFILGTVIAGVEIAVMLRWLEGQEALNKTLVIGSFYLGLAVPVLVIISAGCLLVSYLEKKKAASGLTSKAQSFALFAALLATFYTLSALLLKLP